MPEDLVLVDKERGVTTVTLNRPDALNALTAELRDQLCRVFVAIAQDTETEVVILTGAGRAFCAGLDLNALAEESPESENALLNPTPDNDLVKVISGTPQPVIAAVNGFAITGGFEITLLCDFIIASDTAKFADTHARVGVVPGWGLSQRLARLVGIGRAKQMSLTGNFVDAHTACDWGFVNEVVQADELLPRCNKLARDILSTDQTTRLTIKRIMTEGWDTTLSQGMTIEKMANEAHRELVMKKAGDSNESYEAVKDRGRQQQLE